MVEIEKSVRVHALAVLYEGESFFRDHEKRMEAELRALVHNNHPGYQVASAVQWMQPPELNKLPADLRPQARELLRKLRDDPRHARLILCSMVAKPRPEFRRSKRHD